MAGTHKEASRARSVLIKPCDDQQVLEHVKDEEVLSNTTESSRRVRAGGRACTMSILDLGPPAFSTTAQ